PNIIEPFKIPVGTVGVYDTLEIFVTGKSTPKIAYQKSNSENVPKSKSGQSYEEEYLKGAPDKTLQQLNDAKPEGWDTLTIKGKDGQLRAKVNDAKGNERIRIDPADKHTDYWHIHLLNAMGKSLNKFGKIVDRKSKEAHIPYNKADSIAQYAKNNPGSVRR
ncbi:hypothetical protein, partial [Levilactobacillus brevis]|uniref:hypothetical protein n=1 Tax=Levilactobacillus brevis TaxID=1580 RepID=UPI00339BD1B7